jgi:hypothetical protein
LDDAIDSYACSRAWYNYAQDPVEFDKVPPRFMAMVLFQGYPARAQSYVAERREQEGWFDEGWRTPEWFPFNPAQPQGPKKALEIGEGHNWAGESWEKAFAMYQQHGRDHKLRLSREEELALTPEERIDYVYNRNLSNFLHFYFKSYVERNKEAVTARKLFFQADQLRRAGDRDQALRTYEDPGAFGPPATWPNDKATGWKRILINHPEFRRDLDTQEETYLIHYKYLKLLSDRKLQPLKPLLVVQDCLTQRALPPSAFQLWLPIHVVPSLAVPALGPLDDVDPEGNPYFNPEAVSRAQSRIGLSTPRPPRPEDTKALEPAPLRGGPER